MILRPSTLLTTLLTLSLSPLLTLANEATINQDRRQRCAGMYAQSSWGGSQDPYIMARFTKDDHPPDKSADEHDPIVSLIIFEWEDYSFLGKNQSAEPSDLKYICDAAAVAGKLCQAPQQGEFLIGAMNASHRAASDVKTTAIHLHDPGVVTYKINRTGYYCVETFAFSAERFEAVVAFQNSFGELPAAQIPKLPFYGGLTITYAVVGAFWAFLYVQHRHDILPVQNYITAMIIFMVVEMFMTWIFYDYQNRHGANAGQKVLMIVVAILNAGRNSFSFFLLLIVCMGFGVVKPSLGKAMTYARFLAITHFVFGVVYAIASLSITPDSAGPLVLFVVLPLAATLTTFYIWTLNSLSATLKLLMDRHQTQKALMYKKLWWCILGSIVTIFAFFFLNSFTMVEVHRLDFIPHHWKSRWFVLDGWLNIVYLADLAFIAYLWRPTENNRRFAMSDELGQDDDDGFEIASIGGSLDEEEGGEGDKGLPPQYEPPAAPMSVPAAAATAVAAGGAPGLGNGEARVPPNKMEHEGEPRMSGEGEPLFAINDDADRWTDDDDEQLKGSGQKGRLTGGR